MFKQNSILNIEFLNYFLKKSESSYLNSDYLALKGSANFNTKYFSNFELYFFGAESSFNSVKKNITNLFSYINQISMETVFPFGNNDIISLLKKKYYIYVYDGIPNKFYKYSENNSKITLLNYNIKNKHLFHIVDNSPWPFCTSLAILGLALGAVNLIQFGTTKLVFVNLILVCVCLALWFRDVIMEATYERKHTNFVKKGLLMGFWLFLFSEVMFFFGFFWAFFHSSISPAIQIGGVWPPITVPLLSPWLIPLLNTVILLLSGVTVTVTHNLLNDINKNNLSADLNNTATSFIMRNSLFNAVLFLFLTVLLGILFLSIQVFEYTNAPFTLKDLVYGGLFYILTGFHGFHVFVGTVFLLVCLVRLVLLHFSAQEHLGLLFAILYWHFVDIVWLGLYFAVYIWSYRTGFNVDLVQAFLMKR